MSEWKRKKRRHRHNSVVWLVAISGRSVRVIERSTKSRRGQKRGGAKRVAQAAEGHWSNVSGYWILAMAMAILSDLSNTLFRSIIRYIQCVERDEGSVSVQSQVGSESAVHYEIEILYTGIRLSSLQLCSKLLMCWFGCKCWLVRVQECEQQWTQRYYAAVKESEIGRAQQCACAQV